MRNILVIFLAIFFSVSVISCNLLQKDNTKADTNQGADKLYEKYKNMITEGDGCIACVDCATLALAISYDTQSEVATSKAKLIKYYKKNGTIPCPELVPEISKEIALVTELK